MTKEEIKELLEDEYKLFMKSLETAGIGCGNNPKQTFLKCYESMIKRSFLRGYEIGLKECDSCD